MGTLSPYTSMDSIRCIKSTQTQNHEGRSVVLNQLAQTFTDHTNQDKDTAVILGICVPVNPPKEDYFLDKKESSASIHNCNESSEIYFPALPFYALPLSLDPNLGILGKLPPSNILHEENTLNCWNIEPYFLHILPLATTDPCESSILVFGGLNPCSILKNNGPDFGHEDFVLGSTIFRYLLKTNRWEYYGTMIEPRCYHACSLLGQYVYVTGGYSLLTRHHCEMIATASTDKLNLKDKQWKRCASMITARATHAIVSHESYIYVFGGRSSQGEVLSSVELYNPDKDFWIEITSIPQPTMGLCATCTADTIWIFGGITCSNSDDSSNCLLSDVYSFVPSTKRWNKEPSLPQPCAFSSCVSNDQSLFLIGGCKFSENSEEDTLVSCSSVLQLSLSAKTSKWKSVASLLYPRHATTAVLHDGLLYVLAGMESNNNKASFVTEVMNMKTNMSVECTNLPVPITGCTSIIIKDLSTPQSRKCDKYHILESCDIVLDACQKASTPYAIKEEYSQESIKTSSMSEGDNVLDACQKASTSHAVKDEYSQERIKTSSMLEEVNVLDACQKSSTSYDVKDNYSQESIKTSTMLEKGNVADASQKASTPYSVKDEYSLESIETCSMSEVDNGSYSTEHDSYNKILKQSIGTEKKAVSSENIQFRSSMEMFLNLNLADEEVGSVALKKKNPSALKWLKYFDSVSTSDDELHRKVFEPKINLKTKVDISNVSDDITSKQSFLYIQSNLKSFPLNAECSLKNFEGKKSENSPEKVSNSEMADEEIDNLHASMDTDKISIEDCFPLILVMGGEYPKNSDQSRLILSYYCDKNTWEYVGYLPEHRCHHSLVYLNDKIYVIGGFQAASSRLYENITKKVLCYNICDEMWNEIDCMNYSRAYHSTVFLENEIYVIGGRDEAGNILTSVEAYNESENKWRECKSLPYPVLGAAASALNDLLYVFGGITYEDENEIISTKTSVFDLQNDSWSHGSDMHAPLAFCGITIFSNTVWLFGGLKEKKGNIISGRDIVKFDLQTEMWSKVTKLSIARHASITVSSGSKVYLIGGNSVQDKKEVLTCEFLDIEKNEISMKKKLPIAVSGRAGVLITSISNKKEKT